MNIGFWRVIGLSLFILSVRIVSKNGNFSWPNIHARELTLGAEQSFRHWGIVQSSQEYLSPHFAEPH